MEVLGVSVHCISIDLQCRPGAVDRLRKHNPTHALREVCKVWGYLWDKRSRIFMPAVIERTVEPVLCRDGGKSNVMESITDSILRVTMLSIDIAQ